MVYDLLILLYTSAVRLAALWNGKARLWVQGRKGLMDRIERDMTAFDGRTVWVHCASLGEFEMARPVMEGLRQSSIPTRIVLTFFSPSGYEVRKSYQGADQVFYLPADTAKDSRRFMQAVRPDVAVFVKYDLWWHFLSAAKVQGAQLLLISAVFRPGQYYFRWFGGHGRKCLALFDRIFTVDKASADLLRKIGLTVVQVAGDTRYDRVMHVAEHWTPVPGIDGFKADARLVVCGSTWPEDESVIARSMTDAGPMKWVIAPHEVAEADMQRLERLFPDAVRLSAYKGQLTDMLLVDSIGLLNRLYGHADVAFVGGGFGRVLHNVLEAAAYGLPVVFGPDYATFPDAGELVRSGLAFSIRDAQGLAAAFQDAIAGKAEAVRIRDFMRQRTGATRIILTYLG